MYDEGKGTGVHEVFVECAYTVLCYVKHKIYVHV